MNLKKHIPNALTCGNLICGCLGIIYLFNESDFSVAWFVWMACIFDFFDGFAARLFKVSSPIGKELDSLADMVSFGILPSLVLFKIIQAENWTEIAILPYVAILIAVFSALRLAKFNVDENQKDTFIGVPTPANALFITGLPLLSDPLNDLVFNPYVLIGIAVVFSWLMVSPFELFALKFKNFSWKENKLRFTFLAAAVLLIAIWQQGAVSIVILLYIAVSLVSRPLGLDKL